MKTNTNTELRESIALWRWGGDAHRYLHGDSVSQPSERALIQTEEAMQLIDQYVHQNIQQKLKSLIKEAVVFDNSYLPPSLVDMASGKRGRAYVAVDKIEAELQASLNTEGDK